MQVNKVFAFTIADKHSVFTTSRSSAYITLTERALVLYFRWAIQPIGTFF